ncbi:MAG: PRC-barrel domain-containing protein [Anaerolineales bacterium]|nr:PRC-barrel domain-containing protein [Anaerolineales bacterium]
MLRSIKELLGYELMATDGEIGKVNDCLFSDDDWFIRYLVVDTGPWIFGRKVLIATDSLRQPVWASKTFPVNLTREEVKNSPDIDLAKPVSRIHEEQLRSYYNWPGYWGMSHSISSGPIYMPSNLFDQRKGKPEPAPEEQSHLRSSSALLDYRVFATDGETGEVSDFIMDDEIWKFRYMVTDTSGKLDQDKEVLIALEWINSIKVATRDIEIDLTLEAIRFSPEFDPTIPVNRQYEEVLYDYHGKPKFWQASK